VLMTIIKRLSTDYRLGAPKQCSGSRPGHLGDHRKRADPVVGTRRHYGPTHCRACASIRLQLRRHTRGYNAKRWQTLPWPLSVHRGQAHGWAQCIRLAHTPTSTRAKKDRAGESQARYDLPLGQRTGSSQSLTPALTARTGQDASSRMRWALDPRISLPTGVRRRRPITMKSALTSFATSIRSCDGSLPRTS
jgi:hypothetical protein